MPRLSATLAYPISCALIFAAMLASSFACATELYKWTDANGTVHYSDSAPQGATAAKRVLLNGTDAPTAPEPKHEEANAATAEPKAQTAPTSLPDTPENRKRFCEQAQSQLEMLQSKFQIADSTGKPLDEKARGERTALAKQSVSAYCR